MMTEFSCWHYSHDVAKFTLWWIVFCSNKFLFS